MSPYPVIRVEGYVDGAYVDYDYTGTKRMIVSGIASDLHRYADTLALIRYEDF